MINKIYLHWTAGRYDQLFDDYHVCIDGDGVAHYMGDLEEKKAHTWRRNSNAVGIALCCCYGAGIRKLPYTISWGEYPPTKLQVKTMARCVAEICKEYGLPIRRDTVMTHAEVAAADGYGINDGDPDLRWDLLLLPWEQSISGGEYLRQMAQYSIK